MTVKQRFDLVIFDWAGTMVDFGCEAPVKALLEAFAAEGVPIDEATARRDMGRAKVDHVRALLDSPRVVQGWRTGFGRDPDAGDVERLMARLGPLMRARAAEAAELIPGALATFQKLRAAGVRVASSTGYTRDMMEPVLTRAAAQGYTPEHVLCSGETPLGRPTPLMLYRACADLGVWPLSRVVKVDDAEAGVAEGRAAGAFTVGVAASGNSASLSLHDYRTMPQAERERRVEQARTSLLQAGADVVIDSVADLLPALEAATEVKAHNF